MSIKIMFSPKFPKAVFDVAVEMTPPGFELVPVDATGPQFLDVARDADIDGVIEIEAQDHAFVGPLRKRNFANQLRLGPDRLPQIRIVRNLLEGPLIHNHAV